jgi:hypothetical protein
MSFYFAKNLYATSGAQMRKAAKPMMKKVGTNFTGTEFSNQIFASAVLAQRSMKVQNTRSAIFSTITYINQFRESEVAD